MSVCEMSEIVQYFEHSLALPFFGIGIDFIDYAKAFDCVDHHKLWKILQEMGIPDHLTCLLRNLYAGQEATVRTGHGTTELVPNRKKSTSRLYIVTLLI